MESISVAIRVKPTSRQEVSNGSQWKVVENQISLQNVFGAPIKGHTYTFDKIFGTSIRNSEIYEHAKDLVLSAVSGFNGTVLAYGQTSSGKTYTMQGSASDPGLIRLAIQDVFINIDKIEDREFLVRMSYMEIYNEEINDLLAPENRKLQIYECIEKGIFVAGLREEIADSVEQVIAVLERGEAQRHFAETEMNLNSSRSHTIFRMVIESRDRSHDYNQDNDPSAQDAVRVSTLNLVDLAGSERFSKSGTEGARSKEGAHINKSLTTLGIVINKLSEGGGKQVSHIPYRDSRLTRMLQSALGGNARTAIICTINPDEIHIDETRSTLQFASRAKRVTNCAQVNEILTDAALLKRQKEEIQELRRRLEGSPHTEDLKKEILHLRNDLLKYELGRERLELELQQEMKAQVERERRIKEQEQKIESLSTLVISGAGAVKDRGLPPKKNYKRVPSCPQSTTSNTIEQDLRRVKSGNDHLSGSASIEVSLQPPAAPGDDTFRPSPPSESFDDDEVDLFWSSSCELDSLPTFGDYQDVADGKIWTRGAQEFADDAYENIFGNTNVRPIIVGSELSYASSEFEFTGESKEAGLPFCVSTSSETSMLQEQLNEWNFQCQELRPSMEVEENTKEVFATANIALLEEKSRFQNQETKKILDLMKEMEIELKDCHLEISQLRAKNANLDEQLRTRAALEQTAQDREHIDEENNTLKRNLRTVEMSFQDGHHQQFNGAHSLNLGLAHDELGSESTVSQEAKNLNPSLHLGIRLGNELLQALHSIKNHDIRCLEGHADAKETGDNSLEALLLLLLESAQVVLRSFSNLSTKRTSSTTTKLQHLIEEVANIGSSTFQENCGAAEKDGQETSPMDISKVKRKLQGLGHSLFQSKCNILSNSVHDRNRGSLPDKKKFENNKEVFATELERLNLCVQRISARNTKLAPESLNHEFHSRYLTEQLSLTKKFLKLMKANELLLVRDLGISLEALALQNELLTIICGNIKEFEGKAVKLYQRSGTDPDDTQLVLQGSVYSIYSTHHTPVSQGMNSWSTDSTAVRSLVGQSDTWYQSLDASLPSSQDPGEDICNIDLHQACDEEPGALLSGHSVARNILQLPVEQWSSEIMQNYHLKVQANEHFAEELKIMRNMSEAEKQFTKELLHKVNALEAGLTVAEMEIIEYKVEIEHLRMNNLRTSLDASPHCDDWELQNLRVECEIQKEEIRQLMEQVMTPDHEIERESLLRETIKRNDFLEKCLREAEMRLRRAQGCIEELLQLRDTEIHNQKSHLGDNLTRTAALVVGVTSRQGMSKEVGRTLDAPSFKDSDSREPLNEVSKSDTLIEPIARKFQLLSSGSTKDRASLPTSFRILDTETARNQDEMEHLRSRPPRPALRDVQHNLLQPCSSNNLGGYICGEPIIKKLHLSDHTEKENQLWPRFLHTASQ